MTPFGGSRAGNTRRPFGRCPDVMCSPSPSGRREGERFGDSNGSGTIFKVFDNEQSHRFHDPSGDGRFGRPTDHRDEGGRLHSDELPDEGRDPDRTGGGRGLPMLYSALKIVAALHRIWFKRHPE